MLDALYKAFFGVVATVSSIIFPVKNDVIQPIQPQIVVVEQKIPITTQPSTVSSSYASTTVKSTDQNKIADKKSKPITASTSTPKLPEKIQTNSPVPKIVENKTSATTTKNLQQTPATQISTSTTRFAFDSSWRDAIVNLTCFNRYGEITESTSSGSGVIIDKRGVILTNAHVAADFLFADWPKPSLLNCSVRIGSPAHPMYRATILYMPDEWARDYYDILYKPDDSGYVYGKDDYALMLITERTALGEPLPSSFPFLKTSGNKSLGIGSLTYMVAYPAGFLGGEVMQRDLYMISSPAVVDHLGSITKTSKISDILSYKGVVAGQHGSSGGAVIGDPGVLVGIPTFFDRGAGKTTDDNVLNAITITYVSDDLKIDTGFTLEEFLARGDFSAISKKYMEEIGSKYQRAYADALRKNQDILIPGVTY